MKEKEYTEIKELGFEINSSLGTADSLIELFSDLKSLEVKVSEPGASWLTLETEHQECRIYPGGNAPSVEYIFGEKNLVSGKDYSNQSYVQINKNDSNFYFYRDCRK